MEGSLHEDAQPRMQCASMGVAHFPHRNETKAELQTGSSEDLLQAVLLSSRADHHCLNPEAICSSTLICYLDLRLPHNFKSSCFLETEPYKGNIPHPYLIHKTGVTKRKRKPKTLNSSTRTESIH